MSIKNILFDPNYKKLVYQRRLVTLCLATVLMIVAVGFALLSVCWPSVASASLSDSTSLPLGLIVVELTLLLCLIIVCGYASHMNRKLTPLIDEIVDGFRS